MTKEIKSANFIQMGGILLILAGIFLLYLKARYDLSVYGCLRRGDFYPIDSRNILILAAFSVIFIGVLTELFGRYKLAQIINDIKVFYNRLNLYFITTLFILISIKNWMADSEHLFLVRICVSEIMYNLLLDSREIFVGAAIPFLLILFIYFLLKDYIYLSRMFKSKLPIITFAVCIVSILLFFSQYIFPYNSYEFRMFLESLMSIKVFIPYLIMCLITYFFMRVPADGAKDFSIYDFILNKKRILLILIAALFIATLVITAIVSQTFDDSILLTLYWLYILLLFVPLLLLFTVMFHFKLKILLIALSAILGIVLVWFGLSFFLTILIIMLLGLYVSYYSVIPISLVLCAVLKLQRHSFTKSTIALIAASCIIFGFVLFWKVFV
ncbi:MAG: hypothetical protein LBF71_02475 [Campylobacteraceae bacterium]|jgi:hypothetical protein|nr:hypothetical protein [Campylobacteraceae bacterium]